MAERTDRHQNPRRDARRAAAEKHTAEVAERLGKEIELVMLFNRKAI